MKTLLNYDAFVNDARAARGLCELALDAVDWAWLPLLSRWIDVLVTIEEREKR